MFSLLSSNFFFLALLDLSGFSMTGQDDHDTYSIMHGVTEHYRWLYLGRVYFLVLIRAGNEWVRCWGVDFVL